jgi:cathepsin D
MGGTNSSLYNGSINFVSLIKAQYWTIPMTALGTTTGSPIALSGSNQNAVIDTGTTLIGGPSSVLDTFYAQIPGSARGSQIESSLQDYYIIRTLCFGLLSPDTNHILSIHIACNTNVQATLTFGGQTYTMDASDLIGGTVSSSYCLGSFFIIDLTSGTQPVPGTTTQVPTWIGEQVILYFYAVTHTLFSW